jgi:predicted Zn finger-like uncharacterized protein
VKHRTKKGRSGGKPGRANPIQVECPKCHQALYVSSDDKGNHNGVIRCPYCRKRKDIETRKWLVVPQILPA